MFNVAILGYQVARLINILGQSPTGLILDLELSIIKLMCTKITLNLKLHKVIHDIYRCNNNH